MRNYLLLTLFSLLWVTINTAQDNQSIFVRNFVRHANGEFCTHKAPTTTFTVFINHDQKTILTENAPRWETGGDPNIDGKGTFGIELGNFIEPVLQVGDTVSWRFTCNETKQQGVLTDVVTSIPWFRAPKFLTLTIVDLPKPAQNIRLSRDENNNRMISWDAEAGLTYTIYRRVMDDTVFYNIPRMLYTRIVENIAVGSFTDSTTLANKKYGYIIYATTAQGVYSSHSEEVNDGPIVPPGSDLTISYITRVPKLDYVWGSTKPDVEGWPAEGESIIWMANVKNWSEDNLTGVNYKWYLDGEEVANDSVDIPAETITAVYYPWDWTFNRHELKFVIDTDNEIPEEEEYNNQLTIYTDAITVGFYVEQGVYDYFHQYQKELGVHANCWEDWAQRHLRRWNQMLTNALFPDTPNGVFDRIRIDEIVVVPDGALPLAAGTRKYAGNYPNTNDRTVDLIWGFTDSLIIKNFYKNHTSTMDDNPFYFEGSLLHELGHARYLIDIYGFNVHDDGKGNTVAIKENGKLIVGTEYMPLKAGAVRWTPIKGLMNGEYTFIDRYSAVALNLIAGHRAILGNYNAPGNIGVFMNDLPLENRLTVKDDRGNSLVNADLKVYQATGQAGVWYGKYFDDSPDIHLTTDDKGQALLGRCPFAKDGSIDHTYGISNGVIIIRVKHEGKVGYEFLESTEFNIEYWRGNIEMGNYEISVKLIETAGIAAQPTDQIPEQYVLSQNYPNPFNATTIIHYAIPKPARVMLRIFDVLGKEIVTLVDEKQAVGVYDVKWNGRNDYGVQVASGIYFYHFESDHFSDSKKIIFMK